MGEEGLCVPWALHEMGLELDTSGKAGEGSDWKFMAVSIQSRGSDFHSKEKQECAFTGREKPLKKFGSWFWENFPCFPARFEDRKGNFAWNFAAVETWVFPSWLKLPAEPWENTQDAKEEQLVPW